MRKVIGKIRRFSLRGLVARAQEATGQTLAEYSILVTVVALGITLLALIVFRDALGGAFSAATNCLDGTC
jgi:Flp pilus assembly pilin Flp